MDLNYTTLYQLSDADLHIVFNQIVSEDLADSLFYDKEINAADFVGFIRNHTMFILIGDGEETLSACWLTDFKDNLAYIHYVSFKASKGRAVYIAKEGFKWLKRHFPTLNVVMGLTPANNNKAIQFYKHLNFTELGKVPNSITLKDSSVIDGYLTYKEL